ncbi:MAG: hypothetical protein HC802_20075 [Caldilineaceae bacterium]|nr:hypothetical protein [Caldilineaceae bacterium]
MQRRWRAHCWAWMENFIAGRFLAADRGFNPRDGIAYQIVMAPAGGANPAYFQTWAEIGKETLARGMSNEGGWRRSTGYYGPLARYSLTMMVEVLGSAAARQALAWIAESAPPYTSARDFADDPTYNITLAQNNAAACIATRTRG